MRGAATILGAALMAGCAPAATPLRADHPANPAAPSGRLAGPPPALRAGVAADALVEPTPRVTPARPPAAAAPATTEPIEATPDRALSKPARKKPAKKPADKPADKPPAGHGHHFGGM